MELKNQLLKLRNMKHLVNQDMQNNNHFAKHGSATDLKTNREEFEEVKQTSHIKTL
jgi:hypothetical protein